MRLRCERASQPTTELALVCPRGFWLVTGDRDWEGDRGGAGYCPCAYPVRVSYPHSHARVEVGRGHEGNTKRKKGGEDSIVMDGHDLLDLASLET